MTKRNGAIIVLIVIVFAVLIGIKVMRPAVQVSEVIKPVETITVEAKNIEDKLEYIAIVDASSMQKLGFKSSNKLDSINVQVGEQVKKGDVLATLDQEDINFNVSASESQMKAAKAQYDKALNGTRGEDLNNAKSNVDKAQKDYDYAQSQYEKGQQLLVIGAISQDQMDQLQLNVSVKEITLNQAKETYTKAVNGAENADIEAAKAQYEAAKTDYDYKKSLLVDSVLKAPTDGTVVQIPYEPNEMVSAGYPVIVLRTRQQVVKMGLTASDLKKVALGMPVRNDEGTISGKITRLAEVPDAATHLYEVEANLDQKDLLVGEIIHLNIIVGQEKAMVVPIETIQNDGEDFVFVLEGDKVVRKVVTREKIIGNDTVVKGIKEGDQLITKNVNQLKDGQIVVEKQGENND